MRLLYITLTVIFLSISFHLGRLFQESQCYQDELNRKLKLIQAKDSLVKANQRSLELRANQLGIKNCYSNQDIEYIIFGEIQE